LKGLRIKIIQSGAQTLIEVDGGVTLENAANIVAAGADVLVARKYRFQLPASC